MSDDAEPEILSWIQTDAAKNKTATLRDLQEHITTNYNLTAMRRWVNSFMSRHLDDLCKTKNAPQEAQCL
jgi:gamma-glutamylcysteine synthetase